MSLFTAHGCQVFNGAWHIACSHCDEDTSDCSTIGPYATRVQAIAAAKAHKAECPKVR